MLQMNSSKSLLPVLYRVPITCFWEKQVLFIHFYSGLFSLILFILWCYSRKTRTHECKCSQNAGNQMHVMWIGFLRATSEKQKCSLYKNKNSWWKEGWRCVRVWDQESAAIRRLFRPISPISTAWLCFNAAVWHCHHNANPIDTPCPLMGLSLAACQYAPSKRTAAQCHLPLGLFFCINKCKNRESPDTLNILKGCISDFLGRNINYYSHPISRTSKKRVSVGQPVLRDHTQ